jgi:hypothetical protein
VRLGVSGAKNDLGSTTLSMVRIFLKSGINFSSFDKVFSKKFRRIMVKPRKEILLTYQAYRFVQVPNCLMLV